ncbi:MAG TPA: FAD-binding oxidoreductase [Firmicutes bacterium]|nr:FAD-binding oxidoreductase [Bacillota bacterium]
MAENYDAIIIGAGSVGVPTALYLALEGLKVAVIDEMPSCGQGQNKAAIGGVRATHSDPAKIGICLRSLEIFSTWQDTWGDYIKWKMGGYCFPAYTEREETILKNLLTIQKANNLNIDWVDPDRIKELVPGILPDGLRGGTFSPNDGQVSPLMFIASCEKVARDKGAVFKYNEKVTAIRLAHGDKVEKVTTNKGEYFSPIIVNASGAGAKEIGKLTGLDIPVTPDSHEAGITAPVEHFLDPLVVDIRPGKEGKTANFYFGQASTGQLIFCYTPSKLFIGTDREETSEFMPIIARRLVELVPRFKNLLVRRTWRGLYPMTPDGVAIVDKVESQPGMYLAVGMCGQGFMMGPGVATNIAKLIVHGESELPKEAFYTLRFNRDFGAKTEALK